MSIPTCGLAQMELAPDYGCQAGAALRHFTVVHIRGVQNLQCSAAVGTYGMSSPGLDWLGAPDLRLSSATERHPAFNGDMPRSW